MRFFLISFLLVLTSCVQKKDITFEATYNVNLKDFNIENGYLEIKDLSLNYQSVAEKNMTKKSLIKNIQLSKINSNQPILPKSFQYLKGNQWIGIDSDSLKISENGNSYYFSHATSNLKELFLNDDKLTFRIKLKSSTEIPQVYSITFRMEGKLEKTNVLYRIVG